MDDKIPLPPCPLLPGEKGVAEIEFRLPLSPGRGVGVRPYK